jgi:hypothetical protein
MRQSIQPRLPNAAVSGETPKKLPPDVVLGSIEELDAGVSAVSGDGNDFRVRYATDATTGRIRETHPDLVLAWLRAKRANVAAERVGMPACVGGRPHAWGAWIPSVQVDVPHIHSFVRSCERDECGSYEVRRCPEPVQPTEEDLRKNGVLRLPQPAPQSPPPWWSDRGKPIPDNERRK